MYLRTIGMSKYANKVGVNVNNIDYKKEYRPSSEYSIEYEVLVDDIKYYHNAMELIPDEFGTFIKLRDLLKSPPKKLDFNDHYYFPLCKKNDYIMFTDDGDYSIGGVKIVTLNDNLLKLDAN